MLKNVFYWTVLCICLLFFSLFQRVAEIHALNFLRIKEGRKGYIRLWKAYMESRVELTVLQANPSHTEYSLKVIYNLQFEAKRAISGLIFILLLVFYYSTKITLDVLLVLLYKWPVLIDWQNFSVKHWGYDNIELNWFHGFPQLFSPTLRLFY